MTSTPSLSILGLSLETWASLPDEVVSEVVPPSRTEPGGDDDRAVSEKRGAWRLA